MSTLRVENITDLADDAVVTAGVVAGGALPAGSILQVVSTTKTDTFSASIGAGASSAITGLSASITPSSASNKVLVLVTSHMAQSVALRPAFILKRDSTQIAIGATGGSRSEVSSSGTSGSSTLIAPLSINFLDSPSSTSALTYSVDAVNAATGTQTVVVNRTVDDDDDASGVRPVSTITLMEVAA